MIEAVWDQGFKRSYRKRIQRSKYLEKHFWEKMEIFLNNPFASQMRTHKLSGKLNDDYRVICDFISQDKVLLIDFGTHDEFY